MSRFGGSSLGARLTLLVGLAVAPALILAVLSGLEQREQAAERAKDNAQRLARLVALEEDRLVVSTRSLLATLAQLPQIRNPGSPGCVPLLQTLLRQNPLYLNFGVVAPNGDVVCSAVPARRPVNCADTAWFKRTVSTRKFAVGDFQIGRITGKPSLHFGYPLLDNTGRIQRVLYAAVGLTWLQQMADRAQLPEGASVTVLDRNGTILARFPEPEKWVGHFAGDTAVFQAAAARASEGALVGRGVDGVERLYGYTSLGGSAAGLRVVVGFSRDLAFADADRMMVRNLLALALGALITVAVAWWGARTLLLDPIRALVKASKALAAGDLTARTGLRHSAGELGELARSFDEMADALAARVRERQEAEAALRRENEFTNAILGTAGALVVVLDRAGCIVRFNRTCEQVTGYTFAEVAGKPFWELFLLPEEAPRVVEVWHRLIAGEFPGQHENYWLTKDGDRRLIAWANTCLVNDQGEVEHVVATGIDVTENRRAEAQLRLDEARLQALLKLHLMADAPRAQIMDFALEEGVRLTKSSIGYLAFTNEDETVLTMHAWSKTAMAECAIIDKPIEYPVATTGLWGEALRQRRPMITNDYSPDHPLARGYPEGHVRLTRHMNVPVFDGDHIVAVAGVGNKEEPYDESDVVQLRLLMEGMWLLLHRKDALERLQRAHDELEARVQQRTAELARSNYELEQFAYVASHDLQEPLRKITAFGDRLAARLGDDLPPEAQDYLQRMTDAARRMHILINDLLTYSRVTTRGRPFAPVNLAELAQEVLSDLEVSIEQTGAQVTVGDLPTIDADRVQMRQLLQNLVSNALKFRRQGVPPVVTVTSRILTGEEAGLSSPTGNGFCQLVIQDNGIGFDMKYVDRIFALFQRLHARDEYEGTGIGLAVCRKIAQRHGGDITAASIPGQHLCGHPARSSPRAGGLRS